MKLKFIRSEDLSNLKGNREFVYKEIMEKGHSLQDVFNNQGIIRDSNIEVNEFTLDMSADKPELTDLENIKRTFNNLRIITPSQATDERIWVAYALDVFKEYMQYRWKGSDRCFFVESARRSLIRHGIARLWWIGYLTIDTNSSEPYKYLEYAIRKQDIMENILGRNFSNNASVTRGIIAACIDCEKEGIAIERQLLRDVAKYINLLGGIYILDLFSEKEIYEKTIGYIKKAK